MYIVTLDETNMSRLDVTSAKTDRCYFCNTLLQVGKRKRIVTQSNYNELGIPADKMSTAKNCGICQLSWIAKTLRT